MKFRSLTVWMAAICMLVGVCGCTGGDGATEDKPKGNVPETSVAPPGTKNPEERAAEEQGGGSGDQDGGAGK